MAAATATPKQPALAASTATKTGASSSLSKGSTTKVTSTKQRQQQQQQQQQPLSSIRSSASTALAKNPPTGSNSNTKRPRTEACSGAASGSSSGGVIPFDRRPLPTARELSKVLCRIVDDEAYTEHDAEIALATLHHWALKQNVAFGNHFADVGGLQQVLFFVEDRIDDYKSIASALLLLETLCKPMALQAGGGALALVAEPTIYESKVLANMRTKIGKCIVDVGGVQLMLQTFRYHALPAHARAKGGGNAAIDSTSRVVTTSTLSSSSFTSKESDESSSSDGLWSVVKTLMVSDQTMDDICPMLVCGGTAGPKGPLPGIVRNQKINTARRSMEVLVLLIPHVIGVDKTAPGKILETLCDAVPVLLDERNNEQDNTNGKQYEALIASLSTCLVATCSVASNETMTNSKLAKAKQVAAVTNLMMRTFRTHHGINRDGCLVLQKVCRHLPKSERKRLGVVAALGNVVASESIDQDVIDIADEILEEQFK